MTNRKGGKHTLDNLVSYGSMAGLLPFNFAVIQ